MLTDYIVAGSGLTGSVIARRLADSQQNVIILERRDHLGGNIHDYEHSSGIRVHSYGPHYFRTSSASVWDFIRRYSHFYKFEASLKSYINGAFEDWPVSAEYIERTVGRNWKPGFSGKPVNFEQAALSTMPISIYENFVKGYTRKQWDVKPDTLSPSLAKRFDVRSDGDHRLKQDPYQGLPSQGYTQLIDNMTRGIPKILKIDYLQQQYSFAARKMVIFTGPIDEFFSYKLGRLSYRGQKRHHIFHRNRSHILPAVQVNYPSLDDGPHHRIIEWKHMMQKTRLQSISGTLTTKETSYAPRNPDRYEYPFPDEKNRKLYQRYRKMANELDNVLICGRLGEYKYYDMDQAIARAMQLADIIIAAKDSRSCLMPRVS